MPLVDLPKSPTILFLPSKKLNHLDGREIFLKKSVHLCDLQTDLSKRISGPMAEEEGGNENQGEDRE
jgi:hypothetical protein